MSTRAALTIAAAASLLAACARTVDGTPPPAFPTTLDALSHRIQAGAHSLSSAHMDMRVSLGGQALSARGDEQIANGKASALDLTEQIPSFGTIELVTVGDKTYVRLPKSQRSSDKPWVLVRPGSSNRVVSELAQALQASNQFSQVDSAGIFVTAAKDLRFVGIEAIDGTAVGHYKMTIDVDRLPDNFPQKQTLLEAGLTSLPLDGWFDADGHSRKVTEKIAVAGQEITVVVALSKYDGPVHIAAPPPSQVDTS